jgi:hypothetical protein
VRGKYTFLQDAFSNDSSNAQDGEPDAKRPKLEEGTQAECNLPVEVQTLMAMMFDKSAVERVVAKYECEHTLLALRVRL